MVGRGLASLLLVAGLAACGGAVPGIASPVSGGAPSAVPVSSPSAASVAATQPAPAAPSAASPAPLVSAAPPGSEMPATTPAAPAALAREPILLFFSHGATSDVCVADHPVVRWVRERSIQAIVAELVRGPTEDELAAGYSSWFSPATAGAVQRAVLAGGIARVDFRDLDRLIPNASSSCGSSVLLSSLDATLRQLPEVRETRYSIGGSEARFYEWLQRSPPGST